MGKILADGGEAPGIVYADSIPPAFDRVRSMLPSLEHDVAFELTVNSKQSDRNG